MLSDAIAWSYALLPLPLQALFRRLSVFVGGWSLDALEAACMWDLREFDRLDALSSLLDHSLIRRAAGEAFEPRYEMLHVVREFATERLILEGEQRTVQRTCGAYLGRLARRVGAVRGTERGAGMSGSRRRSTTSARSSAGH